MARTAPGEIKAALPADPPQSPESFDAILADLDRIVVPGLSHWQHPNFFGYFPCNADGNQLIVFDPDSQQCQLAAKRDVPPEWLD